MARRWVFWAGVLVLAAIAWSNMVPGARMGEGLFGAFGRDAIQDNLVFVVPVFVGVTVAGSLAADRRRRYPALVLIRGLSRPRYLLVKAAAMFWVAAAGTFLACAAAFVAAAPFLRWTAAGMGRMEPYPGLLASHPLAGDVVIALLLSLGAGALALSGLAFGALVSSEFVAAAVPFVLLAGGILVFKGPLLFLGPYTELSLSGSYTYALPRWAWSFAAPVYWFVFILVCLAVAAVAFLRREEI